MNKEINNGGVFEETSTSTTIKKTVQFDKHRVVFTITDGKLIRCVIMPGKFNKDKSSHPSNFEREGEGVVIELNWDDKYIAMLEAFVAITDQERKKQDKPLQA